MVVPSAETDSSVISDVKPIIYILHLHLNPNLHKEVIRLCTKCFARILGCRSYIVFLVTILTM